MSLAVLAAGAAMVLLFSPSLVRASSDENAFVPGQCVVKYRTTFTRCAHCLLKQHLAFSTATSDRSVLLDQVHQQLGVVAITPLVRTELYEQRLMARLNTTTLSRSQLRSAWLARVEAARQRYARWTSAAPRRSPAPDLSHIYVVQFSPTIDTEAACRVYAESPHVEWAQPNWIMTPQVLPNDTYVDSDRNGTWSTGAWGQTSFEDLWGLKRIGFEQAWQTSKGEGVTVAVIDTGVDTAHPDLAGRIWVNPCEDLNHNNRVDASDYDGQDTPCSGETEGNGIVDDLTGAHFRVGIDTVIADNDVRDRDGHGTHVAGTLAANADNGLGIAGVAPRATVMPVRSESFDRAELARALEYAALHGAQVINNSWGCTRRCPSVPDVEQAVRLAYDQFNAVVVFGAGNANDDVEAYSPQNMQETITVAATDHSDHRSTFSNHGFMLDLAAPGGESGDVCNTSLYTILSLRASGTDFLKDVKGGCLKNQLFVGNQYYRAAGTSMSAPHVSGAAALILSRKPGIPNEEVRQILRISADDVNSSSLPGADADLGAGRVNLPKALAVQQVLRAEITSPAVNIIFNTAVTSRVPILGTASGPNFLKYDLSYAYEDLEPIQWKPIVLGQPAVTNGQLGVWEIVGLQTPPVFFILRLVATDTTGRVFEDFLSVAVTTHPLDPGDLNGDHQLTAVDALMALQIAVGSLEPTPQQIEAADTTQDGKITASDALCILKVANGLTFLPCTASPAWMISAATTGAGQGTIAGPAISSPTEYILSQCPLPCGLTLSSPEAITLLAQPAAGSRFAGWQGDCAGTGACSVTVDRIRIVTAVFEPSPNLLSNGGFEKGQTDWSGWGTNKTLETSGAYEGSQYAKLTLSASYQRVLTHSTFAVVAGGRYEAKAALRAASTTAPVYVQLRWRASGGSLLRTDRFGDTQGITGWLVRSSGALTAPINAAKLEVQVIAEKGSGGTASVDAVRIETR